ncbi:NRAMP family divalent metal transporter [Pseudoduganella namucuonensis]|uniref:NRAMP (Natural resistance-associated macrophage protein) metal ion transporters n=1 Tax=Pseudoduganella namucuonensis TaxID=1035707 RepID=A0A1I7FTB7_9BURK|nr:divalent metal cation transporter [Pseudoduganella namucuonensis]SFU39398.1 NRAMP (natural resistance-associated macrophage protein) metal ion transporters [Pseudoduganella namucuonensis]
MDTHNTGQNAPSETAVETEPPPASWTSKLGPGLVTGAADDDPSGIATYSQAGAQFGFGMLWTVLLTYPLMVGIQEISARIGRVTGRGLATNIRRHCPAPLLYAVVGLLLVANTINIAADIAAMGQAVQLLAGGPAPLYAAGFGVLSLLLQMFIPYQRYVRILKWLTLALLAYVATMLVVKVPWAEVLRGTLLPRPRWDAAYLTTMVAVFGTTISPYLFFWQSSQEVEELRADPLAQALKRAPEQVAGQYRRIKLDTLIGMGFSNLVAFCIMLTTAVTLHAHGVFDIQSSAQAASALRPVAGEFAFVLFSLGIIGTGLLAVPVLAGSAAYAMAGAFGWRNSLELAPSTARKFYGIIAASTLAGVAFGFVGFDPIQALYWSAVINGVIAVPLMAVMMYLSSRPGVMGELVISRRLKVLGWACTGVMAAAAVAMFATMG